ncbi:MAG: DUF3226 domain-containing protein [Lentisphaerota bacterium]
MRVDLLAVEGAHDLAFVQRILKAFGFKQKRLLENPENPSENIPRDVQGLIPRSFPANKEGDIHKRADVPSFHVKEEQCVVLLLTGGDSKLVGGLSSAIQTLDNTGVRPSSIGFLLDADCVAPEDQLKKLKTEWTAKINDNELLKKYPFPSDVGVNATGICLFGVFVMPDNQSTGTLESILLEQAKTVYPVLHDKADAFIQIVKTTVDAIPPKSELTAAGKNEGKAVLHAMTSVLKPGKTLQTSIADHDWVPKTPGLFPTHFIPLVTCLKQLLGL